MLMGFRPPKRRRAFRSSFGDRIERTREYYYSLFTILVVKIILFVFLWVLFASSLRVMRTGFKNVSQAWRLILPGAIAVIAAIIGYHIYKNIKEIVSYGKDLRRKP